MLLRGRATPATCCGSTATSSPTRRSSSAGSRRSRSRRRCRSSRRTVTVSRSSRSSRCWAGPAGRGRAALEAVPRRRRRSSPRWSARCRTRRSTAPSTRSFPPGLQHYWKANFVTELTDDAIAAHLEHGPKVPAVNSTVHIYPINGACHRVAPDATAFAYRDANFATVIAGMWPDPADNEANTAWVRDYYDATRPTPRRAATSTSWPTTTRTGSGPTTGQLRPAGRGQAQVRPGQPVPPEPEHPALTGICRNALAALRGPSHRGGPPFALLRSLAPSPIRTSGRERRLARGAVRPRQGSGR